MRRLLSIIAAISLLTQPVFASSFTNTNIGTGTVTTVGVTTANGVSGTVTNPTTAPAISISLGAITPSSVAASGTVTGSNLSGTNTGDQTTVSGQAGSVANAVTFNNGGAGAASGTTFNGSAARTVSTNTIGALNTANNLSDVASIYTTAKNLQICYAVAQSGVAVSHTGDTGSFTFATIAIPAMGANDQLQVIVDFAKTGTAGAFTPLVKFGATNIMAPGAVGSTILFTRGFNVVANKNATNSQEFGPAANATTGPFATTTTAVGSGSEETNAGLNLVISGTLASAADTEILARYQIMLCPKA